MQEQQISITKFRHRSRNRSSAITITTTTTAAAITSVWSTHLIIKFGCVFLLFFCFINSVVAATKPNCRDPFGCFPNTPEFVDTRFRPVNLAPSETEKVNTTFYFYAKWLRRNGNGNGNSNSNTRSNPLWNICHQNSLLKLDHQYSPCIFTTKELLNETVLSRKLQQLSQSSRSSNNQYRNSWMAVVVHGYLDTLYESDWMSRIKNSLFDDRFKHNYSMVVLVDWSGGNGSPYTQATANSRLVGSQIAYFIQRLKNHFTTLDYSRVHLIGHSLGSHVAGYAGKNFTSPKLGRITALDPAGPYFEGMPKVVRVSDDDATFVDAIHTNGKPLYKLGYGMEDPVGHLDFYPNGGINQPGCNNNTLYDLPNALGSLIKNATSEHVNHLISCSHQRVLELFIESITQNSSCRFIGTKCDNWDQFKENKCGGGGGRNSTSTTGTASQQPKRQRRQNKPQQQNQPQQNQRQPQAQHQPQQNRNDFRAEMGMNALRWWIQQQASSQGGGRNTNVRAVNRTGKYYLNTNDRSLYCKLE